MNSMQALTTPPVWFERKFDFSISVELLPNLLARLRGTPPRLEDILRGASPAALVTKPGAKWSAQEHGGHLLDMEPLWLARVGDYVDGTAQLTTADLTNRKTNEANHNARPVEQILADFRLARQALLAQVEGLDPDVYSRAIPHPRLQTPMRLTDHLYFVAEHDDHHLAAIWSLLAAAE